MRLLLIEEDARRCAHIRQRLASWRPQAQLIVHSPVSQGALAPEFLAQGFDAVLLAEEWAGGPGLTWARWPSSARGVAAPERRRASARAGWRTGLVGRETQRFGDAFIRGYRCIRRLAAGPMS